jgi:hypothetical protein
MRAKVAPVRVIQTLFGPEEITYTCNTCLRDNMTVDDFYVSSENEHRVRSQCKECWKKYNGRSRFSNVAMFEVKS